MPGLCQNNHLSHALRRQQYLVTPRQDVGELQARIHVLETQCATLQRLGCTRQRSRLTLRPARTLWPISPMQVGNPDIQTLKSSEKPATFRVLTPWDFPVWPAARPNPQASPVDSKPEKGFRTPGLCAFNPMGRQLN